GHEYNALLDGYFLRAFYWHIRHYRKHDMGLPHVLSASQWGGDHNAGESWLRESHNASRKSGHEHEQQWRRPERRGPASAREDGRLRAEGAGAGTARALAPEASDRRELQRGDQGRR